MRALWVWGCLRLPVEGVELKNPGFFIFLLSALRPLARIHNSGQSVLS